MNSYEITTQSSSPTGIQGVLPFAYLDSGSKTNSISQVRGMRTADCDSRNDPIRCVMNFFSGTIVMSPQEVRPIGEIFPLDLIRKGKGPRC